MDGIDNSKTDRHEEDRHTENLALDAVTARAAMRAAMSNGSTPQPRNAGGRYVNGVWTRYERVGDPVGKYPVAP